MTVALGPGGTLSATYVAARRRATDLVFDVTGYFVPDGSGRPTSRCSRTAWSTPGSATAWPGRSGRNSPRTFQVTGRGGVPASAVAVTGNLTVTNQTTAGYLYLGPDPVASPTSSTLNFPTRR